MTLGSSDITQRRESRSISRLGSAAHTIRRRSDGDPPAGVGVLLGLADCAVTLLCWGIAAGGAVPAAVATAGCVATLAAQGGYRTGATTIGPVRILRSVAVGAVLLLAATQLAGARVQLAGLGTGSVAAAVLLAAVRASYRRWLLRERAAGRYLRPVVVVTAGTVDPSLLRITAEHPEAGLRIAGVVEPAPDVAAAIASADASGAIVIVDDVPPASLDGLLGDLLDADLRVYVTSVLAREPSLDPVPVR